MHQKKPEGVHLIERINSTGIQARIHSSTSPKPGQGEGLTVFDDKGGPAVVMVFQVLSRYILVEEVESSVSSLPRYVLTDQHIQQTHCDHLQVFFTVYTEARQ